MPGARAHARARDVASEFSADFLGALFVVTDDGLIQSWNEAASELFGYTSDDAISRSIFETIVPPEFADEQRRWLASAGNGGAVTTESLRTRKDGRRLWVSVSVKVHTEPDGVRFLVLNERDITRVRYQRAAQVLQARFRGVLEAVPDAFVLVDDSGRVALVNSETERLFGYARDELLGEPVELLVPARFHQSHPGHRTSYFSDPQTRPMGIGLELSGRRKNGTEFPVEISL
ncbi:MAG TPA: PAS domain S-box protein, partial [Gemmatimonadaceae bacterium]|nr:PAS domain S-box protein [Gemmatimonadaceae bacterium]